MSALAHRTLGNGNAPRFADRSECCLDRAAPSRPIQVPPHDAQPYNRTFIRPTSPPIQGQPGFQSSDTFSIPLLLFAAMTGCFYELRRREFQDLVCCRCLMATWLFHGQSS